MIRQAAVSLAALLALATLTPRASAQDAQPAEQGDALAEAKRQYKAGLAAYEAKRFVEAALAFEAAAAIKPHAVTLYTAALAWDQANQPERAADAFGRALDIPGMSPPQIANAKDRIGALEHMLGTVAVTGAEGTRVQIDALTEVPVPARLHATPGSHTLTARSAGKPTERRDVSLSAGQSTSVDLNQAVAPPPVASTPSVVTPPPPVAPPAAVPSAPHMDARKAVGFAVTGMGIAALGAGVVLGIEALDAKNAYNAAPSQGGFDHANGLATWTTVAFIAGGVLTAGGLVLVLLPSSHVEASPKADAKLSLSPTPFGAVLAGSF